MNRDRIKGKMKDVKGRVQRQAGEWTDNTEAQIKGAASQVEGKIQGQVGKMKDAGDKVMRDVRKNTPQQPSNLRDDENLRHDEEMQRESRERKVA